MAEFNLSNLYNRAFGPIGARNVFVFRDTLKISQDGTKSNLSVVDFDSPQKSYMGTPLFMPCKLEEYQLPNEPIIEIRGSKNIVKTQIDGQDGTFKELFSIGDYAVTIRGVATQEDGTDNYPDMAIRQIRDLCEKKTDLKITNDLCTIFGIANVVIESYDFPAIEGAPGAQPYLINCISDKDIDIELKNA